MEPADFLNLDLDLESNEDLTPLANYFSEKAEVLYNGKGGGGYKLTAEPRIGGHPGSSPELCTQEMLATLGELSRDLLLLFRACRSRIFDYGFNGGLAAPPLSIVLPSAQLARIAQLEIDLRVTVYPHRLEQPEKKGGGDA